MLLLCMCLTLIYCKCIVLKAHKRYLWGICESSQWAYLNVYSHILNKK